MRFDPFRFCYALLVILFVAGLAVAAPASKSACANGQCSLQSFQSFHASSVVKQKTIATSSISVSATNDPDALAEVNRERAKKGLRPYAYDANLTAGAVAAANHRARFRIKGHTPNDFRFLPAGTSARAAGCGALSPSWGWGSCCTYDNADRAGAAVVIGSDGLRYMHLFVAGSQTTVQSRSTTRQTVSVRSRS